MSSTLNKVQLIGNLGQDPDLRYTSTGMPVCKLSVATTWGGDQHEETEWHRVTVLGKSAERCKQYLIKGQKVYVEGRLKTESWEDKDGKPRSQLIILAHQVIFLSPPAR